MKHRFAALLLAGIMALSLAACGQQSAANNGSTSEPDTSAVQSNTPEDALIIAQQGMFSAGGTVITSDGTFDVSNYYMSREGSTAHVDHANVLYQIPAEESSLPMVFLHGYGQSRMGWMTTPDGREGWSDMFLRMGHSVWLIDQPRRGEAGQTSVAGTITTEPSDQTWYTQFRIGTYLNDEFTYNEGSQFPAGEESLDQFFRQMTPDTGMDNAGGDQNIDNAVVAQAVATAIDEVYERTGKDSILVTHSQGGMPGWETARYTDHVAAIVAIEPGMAPQVDSDDYKALLEKKVPVTFYYGDYIGAEFTDVPAAAMWGMMASTADTFTEAYNAAGGSSTVVHLPDEGITGNDHFMFQDLNNDVIADHIESWIQANVGWTGFRSWTELDEDMIVVSAQLTDWGEKSVRQAIELTEYFIRNFAVDENRVYAAGYSAGGETMSRAISMRPDLYTAYLHGASQWDGTFEPVAENRVAVYIFMAENDEYYGSQKARSAYNGLHDAYEDVGLRDEQIDQLLQLEIPDNAYFNALGIHGNYHGGGNVLFDDEQILNWILSARRPEGDRVENAGFSDENAIAAYALNTVEWARANGIVNGKSGNRFDPKGNATRAEVATILRNYMETQ